MAFGHTETKALSSTVCRCLNAAGIVLERPQRSWKELEWPRHLVPHMPQAVLQALGVLPPAAKHRVAGPHQLHPLHQAVMMASSCSPPRPAALQPDLAQPALGQAEDQTVDVFTPLLNNCSYQVNIYFTFTIVKEL